MEQTKDVIIVEAMIPAMCGHCGYLTHLNNTNFGTTCKGCGKELNVVLLDEIIAPIIFLLNQKGYDTQTCCMGHTYGNGNGYIAFKKVYPEIDEYFKIYPLYRLNCDCDKDVIRWKITGSNFIEKSKDITKWAEILYKIANELPNIL